MNILGFIKRHIQVARTAAHSPGRATPAGSPGREVAAALTHPRREGLMDFPQGWRRPDFKWQ